MFLLRLLTALLQAPLRRLAELLGLDARGSYRGADPRQRGASTARQERPEDSGREPGGPPEPREPAPSAPEPRAPEAGAPGSRAREPGGPAPPQPAPGPAPGGPAPGGPAPPRPAPVAPPPPTRIKEVDESPVLRAEFAEEGAEDGAGAEVHVEEPWEGYARMRVPEVTERLSAATPEELAAVQLYEISHRNRRSVLEAIESARRP